MSGKLPYFEKKLNTNCSLRIFSKESLVEELVWHRDKKDRIVDIVEGEGWEFQFDNDLPFTLKKGDSLYIPAYCYHRVRRGKTDLTVKITEVAENE